MGTIWQIGYRFSSGIDRMKEVKGTEQWQNEVINSDKPVFVDFWAEWCGPCRVVSPTVEELSKEYDGKVNFVKVNVDDNNELASKYNVFSIPTLAIVRDGQVIAQTAGAASKDSIRSYIDKHLFVN